MQGGDFEGSGSCSTQPPGGLHQGANLLHRPDMVRQARRPGRSARSQPRKSSIVPAWRYPPDEAEVSEITQCGTFVVASRQFPRSRRRHPASSPSVTTQALSRPKFGTHRLVALPLAADDWLLTFRMAAPTVHSPNIGAGRMPAVPSVCFPRPPLPAVRTVHSPPPAGPEARPPPVPCLPVTRPKLDKRTPHRRIGKEKVCRPERVLGPPVALCLCSC
jgi:hypothetical protein